MRTKQYTWAILIGLIFSLLLAACQTTPGAPEGSSEAEQADGEAAPPGQETITLVVWDFGGAEFGWMDELAIPAFNEEFPNININHVGVPEDELGLKLETAIAAGEPPDLVVFPPTRVIAAGHVLPVDEYMTRDGISPDDYCPLFHSSNGNIFEDKTYGLPIDTNIWAMVYNKDLFAEAGLPELGPDDYITIDDWLEYSRQINKPAENLEDRVWGSAMFTPGWNSMNNYMSDPFVLGDDGRTCEGSANTDDWVNAFEALTAAYTEDLTPETAGTLLADVEQDMFVQGKLGMQPAALGDALYAREQGVNVGLTGQPVISEGWPGNVGGWNTSYSIMAASEHPDEAWEFVKGLSTQGPLHIPIGSDALATGGGGLPGIPCYLPLLEEGSFAQQLETDPLVQDAVTLTSHLQAPPFTPDVWGAVDPFYSAFTQMTEGGQDVAAAVNEAAAQCQTILDDQWENFEVLRE
jgi:ABC-type glycerol-3-phosphate transport system substrate-binding protein